MRSLRDRPVPAKIVTKRAKAWPCNPISGRPTAAAHAGRSGGLLMAAGFASAIPVTQVASQKRPYASRM